MNNVNPIDLLDVKDRSKIENISTDNNKLIVTISQGSYLGDALNFMPYGVVNKNVTGIGATTLELKSDRDSIIVVPTKALALGKARSNPRGFLYIGSIIFNEKEITDVKEEDIINYIDRAGIKHKFIVVADSLPRLLNIFFKKKIDVYNKYFLMVDEVDIIQSDSTYRPALENTIDFYLKFNPEKRCLVSATLREFSHPILQQERMVIIDYPIKENRTIDLIATNEVNKATCDKINELLKHGDDKILVAYNFIDGINEVISLLNFNDIGVLCGEGSHSKVNNLAFLGENNKLSNRITFMTSAYFAGVDMDEKCHVVSVSTTKMPFTLLSPYKLTQIKGRCRKGILTESFIFDIGNGKKVNISEVGKKLLDRAEDIKDLLTLIDELSDKPSIISLFDLAKSMLQEKMTGVIIGEEPIPLTRKNVDGNYVESFFNIDALLERKYLKGNIFIGRTRIFAMLRLFGINWTYKEVEHEIPDPSKAMLEAIQEERKEKLREHSVRVIYEGNYIGMEGEFIYDYQGYILNLIRNEWYKSEIDKSTDLKDFYNLIFKLRKYYDIVYLAKKVSELILGQDKTSDNRIKAFVFNAMDNKHPFRQAIISSFRIGDLYSPKEVKTKMEVIYETYPTPINIPEEKILMEHFKCFVDVKRTSTIRDKQKIDVYKVTGYNPKKITTPINRIKLTETNDKLTGAKVDIYSLMGFK